MKKLTVIFIFFYLIFNSTSFADESKKLKSEFYTGEIRLSKSFFDSSAFGRDELRALYKNGEWEKLVEAVLARQAAWDTYYFYLGRAAQELGYKDAAIKYYTSAANSDKYKKCNISSFIDLCDGFKFPEDAQTQLDSLTFTVKEKYWEINDAPLLTDLINIAPDPINIIFEKPEQGAKQKSKFETEEEYKNRRSTPQAPYFMTTPLNTNETGKCTSEYEHATGFYIVNKCILFSKNKIIMTSQEKAESFFLSNAFNKREIEKIVYKQFSFISNMTWNGKYKISRDEAKILDSELMVGISFLKKKTSIRCEVCNARELEDATIALTTAISQATKKQTFGKNEGWKDRAFSEGKLEEFWDYKLKPEKIKKIFIYRKTDLRVIYQREFEEN